MAALTALVTGADRGLGLALCAGLLKRGWRVFAGQYISDWPELNELAAQNADRLVQVPLDVTSVKSAHAAAERVRELTGRLDVLINNAGVISTDKERSIREGQNYEDMHRMYDVNALGPLRVVEAFLPLMETSPHKRLCFVSSEAGSIARANRRSWFGYTMSKSALNMAVKILFNDLRPQGFTFRLYHPGWVRSYMLGSKNIEADLEPEEAAVPALEHFLSGIEPGAPVHEDQLVMRDYQGHEWPW
jgi:NAD(P)-dependent dehydrogenase (short-subunit alcohol dehydrogenase family)